VALSIPMLAGAQEAKPQSEVAGEFDRLNRAIEDAGNMLEGVLGNYGTAMTPQQPIAAVSVKEAEPGSPIGAHLRDVAVRVERMAELLRDMNRRCAL
jgi:TPP-dependent indolepyruvate ferredoxin oxidoreductase alpha subunit